MSVLNVDLTKLPPTLTVEKAGELLGLSRATAYNMAHKTEGFPIIKLGKRLIVPTKAFLDWVDKQTEVIVA